MSAFNDPSVSAATASRDSTFNAVPPPPPPPPAVPVVSGRMDQPAQQSNKGFMDRTVDSVGTYISSTDAPKILMAMRIMNIAAASFTIAVGVLAWFNQWVYGISSFFASLYTIIFGALLLLFELRQDRIENMIRDNFGFMYSYKGRLVFLIFVAIWPLSLGYHWLTVLCTVLMIINAVFNFFVIYKHPAFQVRPPEYNTRAYAGQKQDISGHVGELRV